MTFFSPLLNGARSLASRLGLLGLSSFLCASSALTTPSIRIDGCRCGTGDLRVWPPQRRGRRQGSPQWPQRRVQRAPVRSKNRNKRQWAEPSGSHDGLRTSTLASSLGASAAGAASSTLGSSAVGAGAGSAAGVSVVGTSSAGAAATTVSAGADITIE